MTAKIENDERLPACFADLDYLINVVSDLNLNPKDDIKLKGRLNNLKGRLELF